MAAEQFLKVVTGVPTMTSATEVAAAERIVSTTAAGTLDPTLLPPGVGVEAVSLVTTEAITAGALVNIFNNAGVPSCRNANATAAGREAWGFVASSFASGATALVFLIGRNTAMLAAVANAGPVFLGTTAGQAVLVAPTVAGNIVQRVGIAYSTAAMHFTPGDSFQL